MSKNSVIVRSVFPMLLLSSFGFYIGSKLASYISYSMVDLYIQSSIKPSPVLLCISLVSLLGGVYLFIKGMKRLASSFFYTWITAGIFVICMALLSLGLNLLSDAAIMSSM